MNKNETALFCTLIVALFTFLGWVATLQHDVAQSKIENGHFACELVIKE